MAKKRKTRNQKVKASAKREAGFSIKSDWLKTDKTVKENQSISDSIKTNNKYFRTDLTKTFVLTMLVLALELALWQYLTRR